MNKCLVKLKQGAYMYLCVCVCVPVLQNPDIVLVHYLNVPAVDDSGKPCGPVLCSINTDRKEWAKWSKEELIGQLKPMCELALSSLSTSCSHFSSTRGCKSPWVSEENTLCRVVFLQNNLQESETKVIGLTGLLFGSRWDTV